MEVTGSMPSNTVARNYLRLVYMERCKRRVMHVLWQWFTAMSPGRVMETLPEGKCLLNGQYLKTSKKHKDTPANITKLAGHSPVLN